MTKSLKADAVRGFKWTSISTITTSILQIAYTAVMSRLLDPQDFGLIALAQILINFGGYFARMGMGQALIQKRDLTKEDIRVVYTSSLLLGVLFTGFLWFVAPYSLYFFDQVDPSIVVIIRYMALVFLLSGINITSGSILARGLKFKTLAVQEIFSFTIAYFGIGILLAVNGYGVWSLVFAQLCQTLLATIFNYLAARHSLVPLFKLKYYRPLFSYGSKMSLTNFVEFIGANLSPFLVGKFYGDFKLGLYRQANMVLELPLYKFSYSIQRVIFPVFSKMQVDKDRLKKSYLNSTAVVATILIPICLSVIPASREIILIMFGENFKGSIPVLQILSIGMAFKFMTTYSGVVCDATAQLAKKFVVQSVYIICLGISVYFFRSFGLTGFAFIVSIGEIIRNMAYAYLAGKILRVRLLDYIQIYITAIKFGIVTSLAVFIITYVTRSFNIPIFFIFISQIVVGSIILFHLIIYRPIPMLRDLLANNVLILPIFTNKLSSVLAYIKWLNRSFS